MTTEDIDMDRARRIPAMLRDPITRYQPTTWALLQEAAAVIEQLDRWLTVAESALTQAGYELIAHNADGERVWKPPVNRWATTAMHARRIAHEALATYHGRGASDTRTKTLLDAVQQIAGLATPIPPLSPIDRS